MVDTVQLSVGSKLKFEGNFSDAEKKRILAQINAENLAERSQPVAKVGATKVATDIATEQEQVITAENQLGSKLARDPASGVPAELDAPGLRFDLARSDNIDEKINKIKAKFPLAEIVKLDEEALGSTVAIKLPGDEQFRLLDSNKLATFSDITDAAGFILNAETALTILSVLATRGAGLLFRSATTGTAAALGAAVDESIESLRGFQEDPIEDIFTFRVAPAFVAGGVGEVIATPARAGINLATRRGAFSLVDEERAAIKEFEEAGVRGPSVGAVVPAFKGAEGQAVATSKKAQDFARGQTKDALENMKRIRDDIAKREDISDEEIDVLVQQVTQDYKKIITSSIDVPRETSGRALKAGRKEFKRVFKLHIGKKYDRAFEEGTKASFDLTATQEIARDTRRGVLGKGVDKEVPTGIIGTNGKPLTQIEFDKIQLRKLSPELKDIARKIEALDPNVKAFDDVTAIEQVKEIRSQLFDLKNATIDGKETINNRFAGKLWSSLTEVMDNPIGGSDNFRLLLRAANNSNKHFERMLEVGDMVKIAQETEPGALVDLIRPGKPFTIKLMKRVFNEKDFETFRRGYMTKLMSEPHKIVSTLDSFASDKAALDVMLTKAEQSSLREFGNNVARLESSIKAIRKSKSGISNRTKEIIDAGDIDTLNLLVKKAGGKVSDFGKKLRRGVISHILDQSEQLKKSIRGVNPQAAITVIERLDKSGVLDAIMLPAEKEALKNKQLMFSLFTQAPDAGASIQAAELGAAAASIVDPVQLATNTGGVLKKFFGAIGGFTRNYIVGSILMNPTARKIILGAGSRPIDLTTIRILTNITAEAAANADQQRKRNQEN